MAVPARHRPDAAPCRNRPPRPSLRSRRGHSLMVQRGHNLESRVAPGMALLANNLAARLGAVREDALYARVVFLFLGAPGLILALLLTLAVASSGRDRGVGIRPSCAYGALRSKLSSASRQPRRSSRGLSGALVGIVVGEFASRVILHEELLRAAAAPSLVVAAAAGLVLSLAAVLLPAWRDARLSTVVSRAAGDRQRASSPLGPCLSRCHLLAIAGASYWRSAAAGYQVVLAPEGVPATSVDYSSFLAPVFFWIGLGLLAVRLVGARIETRPPSSHGSWLCLPVPLPAPLPRPSGVRARV